MTYYKPLNITKKAVDKEGNEIIWVDPGDRFTYQICFDNNNNDSKVTDVSIVDKLPDEVTFVMAEDGKVTGKYDEKAHTYTWLYGSLDPGITNCVELVVDVNENIPLGTVIANSVTIDSNETLPATADVNLHVGEIKLEVDNLSITPNELRRNGTSPYIKAVLQLPQGIKQSDIDPNDQPVLYYLDRNTGEPKRIGSSVSGSNPTGTEDRPMITVYFSRPDLMNEVPYYGGVYLKIEGKLKDRSYYGYAIIHITIFAGD